MKKPLDRDTLGFVFNALKERFPGYENWTVFMQGDRPFYTPDFIIQRRRNDTVEQIVVEVLRDKTISKKHIRRLNAYVKNTEEGTVSNRMKIFAVYAGTDTSMLGEDFKVMYLRTVKTQDKPTLQTKP